MSVGASDSSQLAQGIILSDGLAGHDHRIEELLLMFDLARPHLPDILSGHPRPLDFFAFVERARYFGAIIDAGVSPPRNTWGTDVWESSLGIEPQGVDLPTIGFVYLFPAGPESERYACLDDGDAAADMVDTGEVGAGDAGAKLPQVAPHLNIGIYLSPTFSRGEFSMASLRRALQAMLQCAFTNLQAHRVQVRLLDGVDQFFYRGLYHDMGFRDEGTRLGAFYDPIGAQWRDELTMGMCATDFDFPRAHGTMWDALQARHASEREDLLRQAHRQPYVLRRSSSMDAVITINDGAPSATTSRASSVVASRASSPLPLAATPDLCPSANDPAPSLTLSAPPAINSAAEDNDGGWKPGCSFRFCDDPCSPIVEDDYPPTDSEGSASDAAETSSVGSYDMMSDVD
ncbi:uncharacterized protein SCHCODRAFT_02512283 [Schizophyllum commune H4-8]|uniref:Uncharacterized protein n=1 Tax=Schizophyllum commune (strain H4-8 / FGSC 9210) TaxID=578458 RepID=D8QDL0_SCHCM|nr:uncharacterized protein SCHCODRAFT_02512283 [Schizophyllum commune H4-8]KAI5888678.1 hypothetical protein SCHCODRAFT_02512283 [Schizophyllum commune H4-8]